MTGTTRSREAGFTLIEVLIVCVISVVVLGATLTAFTGLVRGNGEHERQHDEIEHTRLAMEHTARQLRNLANPTATSTSTIKIADDYDFIFQTSDPTKTWVRYCLQTTGSGDASPSRGKLWQMESTAVSVTAAMQTPCPGSGGWSGQHVVASYVTNRTGGVDRNVFTFRCAADAPASCPASSADYPRITNVGIDLFTDIDPTRRPAEKRLSSAVYLRNQNESPAASFTVRPVSSRRVLLNGSASADPEGRTLQFFWFKGQAPSADELADCTKRPQSKVAEGVTYVHDFPSTDGAADGVNAKPFWLVVRDPGCLYSTFGPVNVVIP
jgi:prepilin-type N-terminal cleavage/methylation domain-containing protein